MVSRQEELCPHGIWKASKPPDKVVQPWRKVNLFKTMHRFIRRRDSAMAIFSCGGFRGPWSDFVQQWRNLPCSYKILSQNFHAITDICVCLWMEQTGWGWPFIYHTHAGLLWVPCLLIVYRVRSCYDSGEEFAPLFSTCWNNKLGHKNNLVQLCTFLVIANQGQYLGNRLTKTLCQSLPFGL